MEEKIKLRDKLVDIALQWQASFGVAPSITSSISEYDAAMLVGMSEKEYSDYMKDKTAVAKGTDFVYRNIRYQVKANRPSGKKGSKVTMVPKYPDVLIYIGRSFVNPKELIIGGVVNDDDEQKLFENYFNNQNPPVPIHFKIIVQNEE